MVSKRFGTIEYWYVKRSNKHVAIYLMKFQVGYNFTRLNFHKHRMYLEWVSICYECDFCMTNLER
jgi:hypothetical protein